MGTPLIRHVRYEDFIAVVSAGASDLHDFQAAIDTLVRQMGTLHFYHVLVDLRGATLVPIPEPIWVEALSYLRGKGLGVVNRIAFVTDPDDEVRTDRVQGAERIAQRLGLHLRSFQEYSEALDWLNDPTEGP
jgi:hypothetical protein